MSDARRVARNSALNLLGLGLPIAVAVVAIPPLMRGLGAERFGLLTLVWAAIGYFSLFELGLSRALTQAVAQRLGNGQKQQVSAIAWSALVLLFAFGVLGGIVVAGLAPFLVNRALNVPAALQSEALTSFYVLSISLPFVVTTVGLRGLMEAHQHFGIVTALRMPLVAFTFVGPLVVLPFSRSLVPAVAVLAIGRALGWLAHLLYCAKQYGLFRDGINVRGAEMVPLLRYGGWATVSNIVSPMMVYLDRFVIGALLPMAAVAHYVTPYELVTKVLVIPGAILSAMFPVFAATFANDAARMAHLYDRSARVVVLAVFPIVLVIVALAHEILRLWMGSALPPESTIVLQWLAVGIFINSVGQVPFAALQSAGRPDLIATLHVAELPLYAMAIWVLVRSMGLPGVAIAWTLRVTIDTLVLFVIARRTLHLSVLPRMGGPWPILLMFTALAGAIAVERTATRIVYVVVVFLVFVATVGRHFLLPNERRALWQWIRDPRAAAPTATTEGIA